MRWIAVIVGGAAIACVVSSCLSPTQITVVVTTDFPCSDLRHVAVSIGTLGADLEQRPPTSTSMACSDGKVGSVVVIPSHGNGDEVAIKVVAGFATKDAEQCVPNAAMPPSYGPGCIVARRALRYIPHEPLSVAIVMRKSCDGIACGLTETCVSGECRPATLDARQCVGTGCSEGSLGPAMPGNYGDMTNAALWTTFDIGASVDSTATGFSGGTFDGRYMYLAPDYSGVPSGVVARYDTQAPFATASSWATFDVSGVSAGAKGFEGATFDGRYVYLVSHAVGMVPNGVVARYDTQAPFASAGSWSTFDVSTVDAGAKGFLGSVFDGRYVYLVPNDNGAVNGIAARYDTQAPFASAGSWSTFDVSAVNAGAKGFAGAAFDARYIYLVPLGDYAKTGVTHGIAVRYDTQAPFGSAGSWSTFDVSTVNAGAKGFAGATFDGRYLYLVPWYNQGAHDGIVARYDTKSAFASATSWSTFDLATVNPAAAGFDGAGFDGRYVYFVPLYNSAADGVIARFDTQSPFTSATSWSTFDVSTIGAGAKGFVGSVFDGRFLYLVPNENGSYSGVVARFDARTPSAMPALPGWFKWGPASFF